ncbi:caspase family protein [Streptomyces sp. TRM68416]|uniref:caspase family protein n=1 Tax=Streptomyces sp. TRM68416 TaxID=2758412 RepID=UPI001661D868|nr:caspase family protein [Streptomyces sp. TRM68416]MBD0838056.1 caspase family protein [Streptomyces sp. TRM68416]
MAAASETAARRYLIATAVTDVTAHPEAERPELADDVRRMEELFLGELGYARGAAVGLNPTRGQLLSALRQFARAPDRRPDDYVVLYLATHGVTAEHSGLHYLLLHDSDARDLRGTALPTEELVAHLWEDTAVERLLVLIDACYAEEGADTALRAALEARRFREPVTEHGSTGLVLVSSSRRKEETYTGALSSAFDRAVRRQATAGHAPAHISLEHVMAAIRSDPEVPHAQRPVWSLAHATGRIPAFLPNPRHIPDTDGLRLEEIDRIVELGARERDAREQDMRGFFLPRARGTDVPTEDVWNFTGRHAAIGDVTGWLAPERADDRLCVVTGDPGSGKSSLLGLVAVLTDPVRTASVPRAGLPDTLPAPGAVDERINASHLSTRQLLDALSAAAGCAAQSLGALTAHLQTRTSPLVVLIDSLDEALVPHEAVDELITPLTDPERRLPLRLLVGARPHIARRLPAAAPRIDLDSERYGDPAAVRAYVRKLLSAQGSAWQPQLLDALAEAVAEAAGRSFLVARITALTIAREPCPPDPYDRQWREELPRLPGEAMERDLTQRLGPEASRARDLLLPLAYAQGAGLPWAGVWPRLASAITGRPYGDEDVVWLRQAAGSYVVESVEDGGSVYRVYHRALIEYLREGRDAEQVQRTVTEVLRDVEHPYVWRYLALHAGEGGVLDPLVQDARFVLGSEPGQLLAALPELRTAEGRRAGQALRDLERTLRERGGADPDPESRARLRLAAVCRRAHTLADSCDTGEGQLPWRVRWAAWNPHEGVRTYPGMSIGVGDGIVVPEAGGAEFLDLMAPQGATWHDLPAGSVGLPDRTRIEWSGPTLTAPPQLPGVAAAMWAEPEVEVARRRRELWSGYVRLLHLWNTRGRQTYVLPPSPDLDYEPERRRPDMPEQLVVVAAADRTPAAAVLRFRGGHVLVHTLGQGGRRYPPLTRRQRRDLYSWEIERWEERADWLSALVPSAITPAGLGTRVTVCAAPAGLPAMSYLLGYGDGSVGRFEWPVDPGNRVTTGHEGAVTHIDLATGHPQGSLLVTAGADHTVRLSSLSTGAPVRTLLTGGHPVASLAVRRVGRQWIVAVVTSDGQLHRIDLDSARPIGLPLRVDAGPDVRLAVFDLGPHACVSVQGDTRGLQLYDLVTGDRLGGQVLRHSAAAVCRAGGTVCVGGSDGIVRFWPTPHAADSVDVTAHDGRVLALGEIRGPTGAPALVSVGEDYQIRCWDLARRNELWRRRVLDRGRWQVPLLGCATTGRTADGRDYVATGEYGGRVRILVLRDGLPVAEQEFTVPDIVTALTTGRVRDRDVLVVGTDTGRIVCWDVGAARMYVYGPSPEVPVWAAALALAPDGSGRLAVGGQDGTVREWSLPTCRPLGPPRRAHQGGVCGLAYTATGLVGFGTDHRLVSYADGWERRLPESAASLHATEDGLLCGDSVGQVWSMTDTAEGRRMAEALDAVRPVSAIAAVPRGDGLAVVVGAADGSLQVRDGERGELVRRLRPVDHSGVEQLACVAWRSPGRAVRPLLFSRSERGLLEYWDFGTGGTVAAAGKPLVTPVPHHHAGARLAVLPDGTGAQSLLSVHVGARLSIHDVARGPLPDQPCWTWGDGDVEGTEPHLVRCAGRLLVLLPFRYEVVRVLDTTTRRWTSVWLRGDGLIRAFTLDAPGGDELLLIGAYRARVVPWNGLRRRFTTPGEEPPRHRTPERRWLPDRRPAPEPPVTHEYEMPVFAEHAALLPGGGTYAVGDHTTLTVLGTHDGKVHRTVDLPSPCTALTVAPTGELVVGTRNGPILFDRL